MTDFVSAGDVAARIEGMRPYLLHGEPWVQVFFSHAADRETIHSAQFSRASLPEGLRVGDDVTVYYLLGAVAAIERPAPGDASETAD